MQRGRAGETGLFRKGFRGPVLEPTESRKHVTYLCSQVQVLSNPYRWSHVSGSVLGASGVDKDKQRSAS